MTESENRTGSARVAALAREVEEFAAAGGWNQQPQLFALVPTADILRSQPELAGQLDQESEYTPVAQDALPEGDLAESLGRIAWPDTVHGCALAQEIIVLPPDAESDLPETEGMSAQDAQRLRRAAADHPRRTEARLVAAVLRDGTAACVMRLRGIQPPASPAVGADEAVASGQPVDADVESESTTDEIIEHPELAPNLVDALRATLQP